LGRKKGKLKTPKTGSVRLEYTQYCGRSVHAFTVANPSACATKDVYPFNGAYHVMVMVIGTSTNVEYGVKWIYEETVGRLTESSRRHGMTGEDRLNAAIAREYVDFLDGEPWYKFAYVDALRRLWTETGFWGPDPLRKWERK
jgi:hypothetical protein